MTFWEGKSVVITGAGSGIGKAIAKALAAHHATVWLSDIDGAAAETAADEIGSAARATRLDVTDAIAVRAHIEHVFEAHGRLDAVFNNAGIAVTGDLRDLEVGHFNRCIDVNIRGVTNGIVAAYPIMVAQRGGIIVNTASAAGLMGIPLMAPYSMTKHAVVGLTNSIRIEAAEHNVQVCALCPAAIETPLLDANMPAGLKSVWRPDLRTYLTKIGGSPYPLNEFVAYALKQIERNKGIIVAPRGARLRLGLNRLFPGVAETMTRRFFQEALAQRT